MITFLLWITVICLVASLYMFVRNIFTYHLMQGVLNLTHLRCMKDIEKGKDPFWRHTVYESVTYDQVLYQFWKPVTVKAFWKDDSFLRA